MPRIVAAFVIAGTVTVMAGQTPDLADRIVQITRASIWRPVAAVPVGFRTFHPQGMAKIGDTFIGR
jgi:hypothetical protein